MGSRLPDVPTTSTVDAAELRRVLHEIDRRAAARAATSAPVRKSPPVPSARRPVERGPLERRPAGKSVGGGGPARKSSGAPAGTSSGGRGLAWALRVLDGMAEWELRADVERDPGGWAAALANIDRLLAQLEAERC